MAAPANVTIENLSGKWQMNKSLGDNNDPVLSLQGIGWMTRKAVGLATVVLTIKSYEQEGVTHIDITSVASGLSTTQEDRTLDWVDRDHEDKLFGKVHGQSRMFKKGEFESSINANEEEKAFLLGETTKDGAPSAFTNDQFVQSLAQSKTDGWVVEQVWGFEEIEGQRRYTRRVVAKNGSKVQKIRLVYDYLGSE